MIADVGRFEIEDAAERFELVRAGHDVGDLPHARRLADFSLDRDALRVAQMTPDELVDARRERRGEERGLPLLGRLVQYRFDVFDKTHVEHFVGFVEHEIAHAAQLEAAAPDVIEQPPGRADDDLHAALERGELPLDRLAAVDRKHGDAVMTP